DHEYSRIDCFAHQSGSHKPPNHLAAACSVVPVLHLRQYKTVGKLPAEICEEPAECGTRYETKHPMVGLLVGPERCRGQFIENQEDNPGETLTGQPRPYHASRAVISVDFGQNVIEHEYKREQYHATRHRERTDSKELRVCNTAENQNRSK